MRRMEDSPFPRPIRDVGSAGRRESVAGARRRRGFEEAWQFLSVFLVRRLDNFAGFADLPIGPWSNATLKSIYRSIP